VKNSVKYDYQIILKMITKEITQHILFKPSFSPVVNRECLRFLNSVISDFDYTSFRLTFENRRNYALDSTNSYNVLLKYKNVEIEQKLKILPKDEYLKEGVVIQLPERNLLRKVKNSILICNSLGR